MRGSNRVFIAALLVTAAFTSGAQTPGWQSTGGNTTTSDQVGIGTTAPEVSLHVATESSAGRRGLLVHQAISTVNSPLMIFRKSRGTIASPLAIQSGDGLGTMYSEAYDGSTFHRTGAFLKFTANGTIATGSIPTDISFGTGNAGVGTERMRITSAGSVGIGMQNPLGVLHVHANGAAYFDSTLSTGATASTELRLRRARGTLGAESAVLAGDRLALISASGWMDTTGYSMGRAAIGFFASEAFTATANGTYVTVETTAAGATARAERLRVDAAGNVGIGTTNPGAKLHVAGNAHFDGTVTGAYIKAHYQDVAEWVPSKHDLAPGTVVVLDTDADNAVAASARSYDTSVAGVVSAQPGIILGEEGASKEQVATTGRVLVKVDASRGPIAIGDLLVTSDKAGYAMRSTPIDVGGVSIHRPGTIIGKALQALPAGEGEILVLLSLQ